ncbi:sugar transferase [Nostoc sp. 106C]|jgi:lipopolysaccharide/colanic/teichoic acid biosynthesis glycosyltransferase|uniref:sugar transferase n=1 Tax=Nostoc sp. 106C TaxID=1932667 RepID=UPI000A39F3F4|nr:sugar transferase [Nostoc sp. 106C]OUL25229.1 sugar transferase [Nostoc sp. RF31YmG]OUL30343.1 sugar transferase [Nostoc sp. 106C]
MYPIQLHSVFQSATSTAWDLEFIPHPSVKSKFKRCLDILGSLVGLLILAIVFVPIAIAIKIDSPGAIFFTQERYGYLGQPFRIRKFRSMVSNAEHLKSLVKNEAKGLIFKNQKDFRVTNIGRFLRRTSLDELPQFWNVLVGEMSLVGTRPPTADEVVNYSPRHWQRLNVKPGLTGEWQVNGRSQITDFEQIVDLDLRYQQNWHIFYDLLLIGRTFYVIFHKIGAC